MLSQILLVVWEICNIIAGTMALSFNYQQHSWHLILFFLVSRPPYLQARLTIQATLLLCGVVGSTARGRSHRFWLASGAYGFSIWFILCVTLIATGATRLVQSVKAYSCLMRVVRRNGLSMTSRFYNESGWSSKPYVYLLGWQYTTIASGAVSPDVCFEICV